MLNLNRGVRLTALGPDVVLLTAPSRARVQTESAWLTLAEQSVVDLALQGLSSRAIAEARCCSPSTVANQLASAYAKLKISGRRELRARLGRE
ncbi:MAG TPA: helix-turn-helix transcriptional regulator [Polyangiaceae bacterium]|nr:helix-turn-helix transcriptional regulator [Polyangiaceae bacterium]